MASMYSQLFNMNPTSLRNYRGFAKEHYKNNNFNIYF